MTNYHRRDSACGEGVDAEMDEGTEQMPCLIITSLKERRRKVKIKNYSATYPTKPLLPSPCWEIKFRPRVKARGGPGKQPAPHGCVRFRSKG